MKREKPENINILYFKAPVNNLIHATLKHVKFKNRCQHPKYLYEMHNAVI